MNDHLALMVMGLLVALCGGAGISAILILLLRPLLTRYALARPNARSSHTIPTPQGGGIAVLAASLTVGTFFFWIEVPIQVSVLAIAAVGLACVGAVDDISPLPAGLRLSFQTAAVAVVIVASDLRIFPDWVPLRLEQAFLILGGVWFVNLVNFMDGLDWITVAEMVPITAFIALVPLIGTLLPIASPVLAAILCGALLGFAPFNKPVARLFLGDVGSLSIGLLVGWLLLNLAAHGGLAAAILLPLYYLMDATITLLRRLARGERVWEAHRSHFYQQATANGFSALAVSAHVFGLNLALAALAAMTLIWPAPAVSLAAVLVGISLVGVMLRHFAQPRPETAR